MESPAGAARRFRRAAEAAFASRRGAVWSCRYGAARGVSKAVKHMAAPAPTLILNPILAPANDERRSDFNSHGGGRYVASCGVFAAR